MNFLSLGDPANGTSPITLPARNNAGNIVRVMNFSSSTLQFYFPGNNLQIVIPSRTIRKVNLVEPERRTVAWQVLATDPTFVGTSHAWLEVYSPAECDHPFEQAAMNTGSGAIQQMGGVINGVNLTWDVNGIPTNPNVPLILGAYGVFDVFAPAAGLYLANASFQVQDGNQPPGQDDLLFSWQNFGADFPAVATPSWGPGYQAVAGGTLALVSAATNNQFVEPELYQMFPILLGAVQGDEIQFTVDIALHGSTPYASPPSIKIWATLTLLAAG